MKFISITDARKTGHVIPYYDTWHIAGKYRMQSFLVLLTTPGGRPSKYHHIYWFNVHDDANKEKMILKLKNNDAINRLLAKRYTINYIVEYS